MKTLVLCSGGIDSTVALYDAHRRHEVLAGLSFEYGSKHNHRELPFAVTHCEKLEIPHQTIDLGFIGKLFSSSLLQGSKSAVPDGRYEAQNMRQTVVPFRNGIMLAAAAGLAESLGADGLVIGAHSGDHAIYPDCREEFMAAMSDAIAKGTYENVQVLRPLIAAAKADVVKRGAELGIDFSQTWSCYKGGEIHCGTCATCVERREAFAIAGIPDPTSYATAAPAPPSETNR